MDVRIETRPACHVVGLRAAFVHALSPDANNHQVIGRLWTEYLQRVTEVRHRIGTEMLGIITGEPEDSRSHPDELQYTAAVPVSQLADWPREMVGFSVPAGSFAVVQHRGVITDLSQTVGWLYRDWLPQSGYWHAEIADVETYGEAFCGDSETSVMDYAISVLPADA